MSRRQGTFFFYKREKERGRGREGEGEGRGREAARERDEAALCADGTFITNVKLVDESDDRIRP